MRGIDGMYISTSLSIDQRGLSHLDPSIQANVVVESKFKAKCEDISQLRGSTQAFMNCFVIALVLMRRPGWMYMCM